VKVALSKRIYVYRILKIKWEQLFVVARYWASERYKTLAQNINSNSYCALKIKTVMSEE
jgi:hypothetical protein